MAYQTPNLKDFFKVRLVEIVQIVVTFLIAVYITYRINSIVNLDIKKREVVGDLLKDFQKDLTTTLQRVYSYINKPNETDKIFISQGFKQLSIMLYVLYEIKKDKKNKLDIDVSLKQYLWTFKKHATGHTFGGSSVNYSDENKMKIESSYSVLQRDISLCRVKLYS